MALVVFLRGLNVGGHRSFRPTRLAEQLRHLDAVNIGATGTLVIRRPIGRTRLRNEIARKLPFEAAISICPGSEILELLAREDFAGHPVRGGTVRFVSILARRPPRAPDLPITYPSRENGC